MRRITGLLAITAALAACGTSHGAGAPTAQQASSATSTTAAPVGSTAPTTTPDDTAAADMLRAYADVSAILDQSLSRAGHRLLSRKKLVSARRQDAVAASRAVIALRGRTPPAGVAADVRAAYDAFMKLSVRLQQWSRTVARPTTDATIAAQECRLTWWRSQAHSLLVLRILADGKMSVMASLHDLAFQSSDFATSDARWVTRQLSCFNASENYVNPLLESAAKTRFTPDAATADLCLREIAYLDDVRADMRRYPLSTAPVQAAERDLKQLVADERAVFVALEDDWRHGASTADRAIVRAAPAKERGPSKRLNRDLKAIGYED
jgi:hypothetical protein